MCIATGFLNCILMDKVQSALFSPYKALVWQTGSKRAFQVVLVFLESIRDISRTGLRLEINPARWHSRPICLNKNKCARDAILDASTPPHPPRNLIHMTIQTGIWVVIRPRVNADYSLCAQTTFPIAHRKPSQLTFFMQWNLLNHLTTATVAGRSVVIEMARGLVCYQLQYCVCV